jgi:hypothetical protein
MDPKGKLVAAHTHYSGSYIPAPCEPGVFTSLNGRPIWWRDTTGRLHACEGAEFDPGVPVYWTLCERDVPSPAVFHPASDEYLTCPGCVTAINARAAAENGPQGRHQLS